MVSKEKEIDTSKVPNAPCGVERSKRFTGNCLSLMVPNAPCGVERSILSFLSYNLKCVPNAPCGVERLVG